VYASSERHDAWTPVLAYPIKGMSGRLGPKLREGDLQVPEGIYYVEFLNANSRFHLSIRLNYPNRYDRAQAAIDGRTRLGSDIMIHGMASSIGCLAMGNEAAEDLFVLAALVGRENIVIVVSPTDFRRGEPAQTIDGPTWLPNLYERLRAELRRYPRFPS
jgi:murein L,D-transpeptidase YafK